jgi:hypothetical protein
VLGDKTVVVESVKTHPPVAPKADVPGKLAPLLAASRGNKPREAPRPLPQVPRLEEMAALEGTLGGTAEVQLRVGDARVSLPASDLLALTDRGPIAMSASIPRKTAIVAVARQRTALFTATIDRIFDVRSVTWRINRVLLDPVQGEANIDGVGYKFSQTGLQLMLSTDSKSAYEFELRVTVENESADRFETSTCVPFDPVCRRESPVARHWKDFVGLVKGLPVSVLR